MVRRSSFAPERYAAARTVGQLSLLLVGVKLSDLIIVQRQASREPRRTSCEEKREARAFRVVSRRIPHGVELRAGRYCMYDDELALMLQTGRQGAR
jgi:hypothetical protein